jgi:hypothetical protein
VSKNEAVVAFAAATTLNVVNKLSGVDTQSWSYVSQQAPEEDFLRYLATQNIFSSKVFYLFLIKTNKILKNKKEK